MTPLRASLGPLDVPVFPLPNLVFFPGTVLPLHVFEPRYRELVSDACQGPGLFAVSLLCEGWESEYEHGPPFHPVATVGKIDDLESLPDGRFTLNLVGLQRVRLGEVLRERPYRSVRSLPLPESGAPDTPETESAKLELLTSLGVLRRRLSEQPEGAIALDESLPFDIAVNGCCANLPVEPAIRQSLLAEDDMLRRCRRATELADAVLRQLIRSGETGDGDVPPPLN